MIKMLILGIKIYPKTPVFLTIQKPYIVDRLSVANFAATIKPNMFNGSNYKCWCDQLILWMTVMNLMHVTKGKPEQFTLEEGSAFNACDNLFRDCIISVLAENIVDTYIQLASVKEMWDALEAQYGVSHADSELYVMEQFLDNRMVEDRSVVDKPMRYILWQKDSMCDTQQVCGLEVLSLSCHFFEGNLLLH
jgi:hypothetical protein